MQIEAAARSDVEIRGDLGSLKVLVVDDEASIREALESYLYHLGISTVHTAQNGKIALEALKAEKFDYLFMDLMMPEMDGLELMKRLGEMGEDGQQWTTYEHYRDDRVSFHGKSN